MKTKTTTILALLGAITLIGNATASPVEERVFAVCTDSTRTIERNDGACLGHGRIEYWAVLKFTNSYWHAAFLGLAENERFLVFKYAYLSYHPDRPGHAEKAAGFFAEMRPFTQKVLANVIYTQHP